MQPKQATDLFNSIYEAIIENYLLDAGAWLVTAPNNIGDNGRTDNEAALQMLWQEAQRPASALDALRAICFALHQYLRTLQSLPDLYENQMSVLLKETATAVTPLIIESPGGAPVVVRKILHDQDIAKLSFLLITLSEYIRFPENELLVKINSSVG